MTAQQYGHSGKHHGRGTPDCPTGLHHHHDDRCVSPLEDRRQRAWEAFHDAPALDLMGAITEAIETATRVRITDEAIDAASCEYVRGVDARNNGDMHGAVRAALRELGFEVEE